METAIEVIRWSGLVLALFLTVVILKEVAAVVRTLSQIRELAERIRDASLRAAEHVKGAEGLAGLEAPLAALRSAGGDAAAAAGDVAARIEERAEAGGSRGGSPGEGRPR